MNRKEIQEKHEASVLDSFKKFYNKKEISIEILERPDPPDAIAKINNKLTWIEITDGFLDRYYAENINNHAIGIKNKSVVSSQNYLNPDKSILEELISVIIKKYSKRSIGEVYKKYGKGILLVGMYSPFSPIDEILKNKDYIVEIIKEYEEQRFKSIYLYDNSHIFCNLFDY